MTKKNHKGRTAADKSPLLDELDAIRINYKAAKAANDEAAALTRLYHKQFPHDPAAAVARYVGRGLDTKARIWRDLDAFEMKLRDMRSDAPVNPDDEAMQAELAAFEAAKKALDADVQARFDLIGVADVDDLRIPSLDDEYFVCELVEMVFEEPAQTPTCLLIKARLLRLFGTYEERKLDWANPVERSIANDRTRPLIGDRALDAAADTMADYLAKQSPHAAEVDAMIEEIKSSLLG